MRDLAEESQSPGRAMDVPTRPAQRGRTAPPAPRPQGRRAEGRGVTKLSPRDHQQGDTWMETTGWTICHKNKELGRNRNAGKGRATLPEQDVRGSRWLCGLVQ